MTLEDTIKRRIQKWHAWEVKWARYENGGMLSPTGRRIPLNNSYTIRQRRLEELVRAVMNDAISSTQNPPAKVTSFNKYENPRTKKN